LTVVYGDLSAASAHREMRRVRKEYRELVQDVNRCLVCVFGLWIKTSGIAVRASFRQYSINN
jgi:hypothetical protein